jgi:hypothetical protein
MHNSLAVVLTYLMTFMLMSLFVGLCTVQHLRCDEEGLQFVRPLGAQKILWADVESIEEVSRAEVVLRGWLSPRFPSRESTASWTSVGHFRIRWQGGTAYFPPKDVQRFLYAMQTGREHPGRRHHGDTHMAAGRWPQRGEQGRDDERR